MPMKFFDVTPQRHGDSQTVRAPAPASVGVVGRGDQPDKRGS